MNVEPVFAWSKSCNRSGYNCGLSWRLSQSNNALDFVTVYQLAHCLDWFICFIELIQLVTVTLLSFSTRTPAAGLLCYTSLTHVGTNAYRFLLTFYLTCEILISTTPSTFRLSSETVYSCKCPLLRSCARSVSRLPSSHTTVVYFFENAI